MADKPDSGVRTGPEWERAKERTRRRDQYRCQHCRIHPGVSPDIDLQVHHIRPVGNGGSNDLDNLVLLCNNCHGNLHGRFDDREQLHPELLEEYESSTIAFRDYRHEENLTDSTRAVLKILRENGPMQLKDIADEANYSRSHTQKKLKSLMFGGYVCRISRGVYAYITTLAYREMKTRDSNEYGRIPVEIWDPGEQVELTRWTEDGGTDA